MTILLALVIFYAGLIAGIVVMAALHGFSGEDR